MRRAVHIVVLALLLFAQQRAVVHPIEHLADRAAAPRQTTLYAPQVELACVQCALLAGGTDVVGLSLPATTSSSPSLAVITSRVTPAVTPASAWFDSRAPPLLA